jgi:hypothetical protein
VSGFLAALVARVSVDGPSLMPRLPARYESPGGGAAADDDATLVAPDTPPAASAPRGASAVADPPAPPASRSLLPATPLPEPAADVTVTKRHHPLRQAAAAPARQPAMLANSPLAAARGGPAGHDVADSVPAAPPLATPLLAAAMPARAVAVGPSPAPQRHAPAAAPASVSVSRRGRFEPDPPQRVAAAAPDSTARPAQPQRAMPALMPAPRAASATVAAAPTPARDAVAAAPTIHVTIGRVEVRAVVAPAAAPRTATRPASLSLEQFLAQQAQRGAR